MTSPNSTPTLSDDDARVFDTLAEDGLDLDSIESMTGDDRKRGEKLKNLFSLLEHYPVEDASEDLVNATLARVNRAEEERDQRLQIQTASGLSNQLSGRRLKFPDLFATAAMMLLAVGVIWPVMNHARQSRMTALDHDNMTEVHDGMTSYASANNGATPMQSVAQASILPDPFNWMGSDAGKHNEAIRKACDGYAQTNDFHQPEGSLKSDPYSFQLWQDGDQSIGSDQPMVSNTNPLPLMNGPSGSLILAEALKNSRSHAGAGQNVLFGDGHVEMFQVSEINGDRLWDPGSTSEGTIIGILRGEMPNDQTIFLIH